MSETIQENFTFNDRGVFVTLIRRLSVRSILRRRAKLQGEIVEARENFEYLGKELPKLEAQLRELNSPTINQYINTVKERERLAAMKAEGLLKEFVGEKAYKTLQEKGHMLFQAKDGLTYRIDRNGRVSRKTGNSVERLCVIRPSDLPLPDFVTSLFVNIRENPTKYPRRR